MDQRQRVVLTVLWLAVALLMLTTVEAWEASLQTGARLLVVALATGLAVVYLLDPWGVLERYHL